MACVAWSSLRIKMMLGRCSVCCAIADNADKVSAPIVRFLFIVALFYSLLYCESSFILVVIGMLCNPKSEVARLRFFLHINTVEGQLFGAQIKSDLPDLTRFQGYLLKTFQLLHRTGDTSYQIAYVELYHHLTIHGTAVMYSGSNGDLIIDCFH